MFLNWCLGNQLEEAVHDNDSQIQELRSILKKYSHQAVKTQEVLQYLVKETEALKEYKNQIQILTFSHKHRNSAGWSLIKTGVI